MRKCIYPGSFDPPTLGHLNIIERCAKLFDEVHVCILTNINKKCLFSVTERIAMLKKICVHLPNVCIEHFEGLMVHYAEERDIFTIVRGIRNSLDLEMEMQLAEVNKRLNNKIETLFLPTSFEFKSTSSSVVKELLKFKANITPYVPSDILNQISLKEIDYGQQ